MSPYRILAAACLAAGLAPFAAAAENTIKIGFPMPLSGPASVYGVPITKGAEMAVQEINAKGGVLGRKLELLERDSKANADEAVRLARELIIKNNVDFLSGTLTSAEAPAVSTIAKENKIVFIAPTAKTMQLTAPANLHPYIWRLASNTDIDGRTGALRGHGGHQVEIVVLILVAEAATHELAYYADLVGVELEVARDVGVAIRNALRGGEHGELHRPADALELAPDRRLVLRGEVCHGWSIPAYFGAPRTISSIRR